MISGSEAEAHLVFGGDGSYIRGGVRVSGWREMLGEAT